MESETKKRKMVDVEGEKAEEEEEEKIEKFFALIRSTRDMHHELMRRGLTKEAEEKKVGEQEKVSVVWNPSFQPEDFMENAKKDSQQAGPSKRPEEEHKEKKEEEEEEGRNTDGLDLKLSL